MRRGRLLVAAMFLAALIPGGAAAHAPDPAFSSALWGQDQSVPYRWKSGQVPPAWLQPAINAAAGDSNATRAARAATFWYSSSGAGVIGYGEPSGCGTGGLACFTRSGAPTSFTMSFRGQGYRFDWGALNWCQYNGNWASGCFDAENIALDEFGHVLILTHHANWTDASDYADAVVQTVSRANPKPGWSAHAYARCDVATLQRKYDVQAWTAPISTCLNLATVMTFKASATGVRSGASVTFTATLRTKPNTEYERLADNPLHARNVVLQRAPIGGSTWVDVGAMSAASAAGTYLRSVTINGSYQWRAVFRPSGEGVRAATSSAIAVRIQ